MKKKHFKAMLALFMLLIVPWACQSPLDERPEEIPSVQRNVVNAEDIPGVIQKLQVKLGLPTGVDQFSTAGGSEDGNQQLKINWDEILQLVDSTGRETYTFSIEDSDQDFATFYNLILQLNADEQAYQPFLLKYEMDESFIPTYLNTGTLENFTGYVSQIVLNGFGGIDKRGRAAISEGIDIDGTVCPNGGTRYTNGSTTPGSGGGWTTTNPGPGLEDPNPVSEIECNRYIEYTDWYNSSDGSFITRTFGSTYVECTENKNSSIDANGCAPLWGEIGIIIPEEPCKTTAEEIAKAFPNASKAAKDSLESLINEYSDNFGIDTKEKLQHFLAQAGHESGGFTNLSKSESMYYTTPSLLVEYWPSLFSQTDTTKADPDDYLRNSKKLANRAYSNKYGNGDEASGDGYKYRGRGIFQLTFKANYQDFTDFYQDEFDSTDDFVENPGLIASNSRVAILSAMWYYKEKVLDVIDVDSTTTVLSVTKKINSEAVGLDDRKSKFNKTKEHIDDCDE